MAYNDWGFFAHKKINRLAVFTCPPSLVGFFKDNIDYLTEHAIDPDMRRHASKYEAIKHYIDIDHWGTFPFKSVPRNYPEAILKFGKLKIDNGNKDITYRVEISDDSLKLVSVDTRTLVFPKDTFVKYFRDSIFSQRYQEPFKKDLPFGFPIIPDVKSITVIDSFSDYGIVPFSLLESHFRLVDAFKKENTGMILKLSSDYGHYIADAHVPLHTTENYNGQLTGQDGIHAFWESRLPELYADKEYDFFVGKAEYVNNLSEYFWDIVLDSHAHLEKVLGEEMRLRKVFPQDQQFCYDERNGRTVRIQCPEFARAYQLAMGDMVEERFRSSIQAIGNLWYTAWVQAGRPNLHKRKIDFVTEKFDSIRISGKLIGRGHEGEKDE
jgi:hypothetical protein